MFVAKLDTFGYRVSFGNGHVCIYRGNDLVGPGHFVDGLYQLLLHDSHMPALCFVRTLHLLDQSVLLLIRNSSML